MERTKRGHRGERPQRQNLDEQLEQLDQIDFDQDDDQSEMVDFGDPFEDLRDPDWSNDEPDDDPNYENPTQEYFRELVEKEFEEEMERYYRSRWK